MPLRDRAVARRRAGIDRDRNLTRRRIPVLVGDCVDDRVRPGRRGGVGDRIVGAERGAAISRADGGQRFGVAMSGVISPLMNAVSETLSP